MPLFSTIIWHFRLTLFCTFFIWFVCIFKAPHVEGFEFPLHFDKVVHFVMYLGLCLVFWGERCAARVPLSKGAPFVLGVAWPILMSGLIELAQAYLTTDRSGDWLDFAANTAGVLAALGAKRLLRW